MATTLNTDYLLIGCGAVGMAFADTLLTETDSTLLIIDRQHQPGGHWLKSYPFVTLHQPSQFYGVSSRELSNGRKDTDGLNKGLHSLATGAQIVAYYESVMQDTFLQTGRVRYFPMSDYHGDGRFSSLVSGEEFEVIVNKKVIDATFLMPTIPATHTPGFSIDEQATLIPVGELPDKRELPAGYVVMGGGKTGIDACLWLLAHRVDPEDITWIMPRDAWFLDRRNAQPSVEFFDQVIGSVAVQMESAAQANSMTDMYERLEAGGYLLRLDKNVWPTMFHSATVSSLELEQLQRIKNVVRLGRVTELQADQIILQQGTIETSPAHLHIDCTASAISHTNTKPIFEAGLITPQLVRAYQPIFSASLIAYVEAHYDDLEKQNDLCTVVPIPNTTRDYLKFTAVATANQFKWTQDKSLRRWIARNRLDGFSAMAANAAREDEQKQAMIDRIRVSTMPGVMKMHQFLATESE